MVSNAILNTVVQIHQVSWRFHGGKFNSNNVRSTLLTLSKNTKTAGLTDRKVQDFLTNSLPLSSDRTELQ